MNSLLRERAVMLAPFAPMMSLCDVPPRVVCLQPECSCHLTVTWTPTEEGGIRELLVLCANGVLKQQAVMLGRAEAPKKKKVQDEMLLHLHQPTQLFKDAVSVVFIKFKFNFKVS